MILRFPTIACFLCETIALVFGGNIEDEFAGLRSNLQQTCQALSNENGVVGSTCFWLESETKSFDDAQAVCQSKGGNLARIFTNHQAERMMLTTQSAYYGAWVGAKIELTGGDAGTANPNIGDQFKWFGKDGSTVLSKSFSTQHTTDATISPSAQVVDTGADTNRAYYKTDQLFIASKSDLKQFVCEKKAGAEQYELKGEDKQPVPAIQPMKTVDIGISESKDCGFQCLLEEGCVAFAYGGVNVCRLYNTKMSDQDLNSFPVAAGVDWYQIVE